MYTSERRNRGGKSDKEGRTVCGGGPVGRPPSGTLFGAARLASQYAAHFRPPARVVCVEAVLFTRAVSFFFLFVTNAID